MAIVIPFNPYQNNINADTVGEIIKTSADTKRVQFVPRKAPFFSRNVKLYKQGSNTPLKLGIDYGFANPFDNFITKFSRNCFGSVVMIGHANETILMDYSSIGGPFVLDEIEFAKVAANIINSPRIVDWSDLTNVPAEFPSTEHTQPAEQTYDYKEMMDLLRGLLAAITSTEYEATALGLIQKHMNDRLNVAHKASGFDIALPDVENTPPAKVADLDGGSSNKIVTIDVLKEALRLFAAGKLKLD